MYTHSATTTYSAMRAISGSVSVSGYNLQGFTQTNTISAGAGTSKAVSSGVAETSGTSVSSGFGVTIKEMDIICIPPKSAKVISEYNINKLLYRDCNLFIRPTKKQIRISSFSEDESPFIFSNRISYCVDENGKPITMEHKFYVSEISNIIEEDMTTYKIVKVCEDEQSPWFTGVSRLFYKDPAPDKFFIKYSYPDGYRKH